MDAIGNGVFPDITPAQVRAARALLGWSRDHLASVCGVTVRTLDRLEAGRHASSRRTAVSVRTALEAAGVVFIPQNGGGPGVRLRDATSPTPTTAPPSFAATIGAALEKLPERAKGDPESTEPEPQLRTVSPEDEVRGERDVGEE
ncbi:helix-turn-helix domain-containing protein [Teichococcus aestuarii]|uniref:helix-turn-helix domain-containing protein n=1 Tax=Teichococcus aestuarii TaxID=568898 RepID=UPI00360AED08